MPAAPRNYGSANAPPEGVRLPGRLKRTAWATVAVCVLSAVGFALLAAPRRVMVDRPVELSVDPAYEAYVAEHGISGTSDFTVRTLSLNPNAAVSFARERTCSRGRMDPLSDHVSKGKRRPTK